MAGYSWINQMDFTHPGTVAIGSYQNASKERGEKKAREMKFLNDQKMLEKLTLEVSHLPEKHAMDMQQAEHKILVDQLTAMLKSQEIQYAPEMHQAKLGSEYALQNQRNAAANKSNRAEQPGAHNFGTSTGISRQIADALELERLGFHEEAKIVRDAAMKDASGETAKKGDASGWLRSLPKDQLRTLIAKADVYTNDSSLSYQLLSEGNTLEDISVMFGGNPEDIAKITPNFAITTPMLTAVQKQDMATNEVEALSPIVNEYLSEYQTEIPIYGYSLSQVKDLMTGQNKDKQAKFLAGTILYSELQGARARSIGGQSGIEMLKHLEERSLGNYNASVLGLDSETFKKMNELVDEGLKRAGQIAREKALNPGAWNAELRAEKETANKSVSTKEEKKETPKFGLSTKAEGPLGIFRSSKQ